MVSHLLTRYIHIDVNSGLPRKIKKRLKSKKMIKTEGGTRKHKGPHKRAITKLGTRVRKTTLTKPAPGRKSLPKQHCVGPEKCTNSSFIISVNFLSSPL